MQKEGAHFSYWLHLRSFSGDFETMACLMHVFLDSLSYLNAA